MVIKEIQKDVIYPETISSGFTKVYDRRNYTRDREVAQFYFRNYPEEFLAAKKILDPLLDRRLDFYVDELQELSEIHNIPLSILRGYLLSKHESILTKKYGVVPENKLSKQENEILRTLNQDQIDAYFHFIDIINDKTSVSSTFGVEWYGKNNNLPNVLIENLVLLNKNRHGEGVMSKQKVFTSKPGNWCLIPPRDQRTITVDNGGRPLNIEYQDIFITVVGQDTTPRYVLRHGNGTSSFTTGKVEKVFRSESDGSQTLVFEVKKNGNVRDVFDHRLNMFVRDSGYHEAFKKFSENNISFGKTDSKLVVDKTKAGLFTKN